MKGVVFTELMEVLEQTQGPDFVDNLIDSCDLPSGGAYTSVGTYDYSEMKILLSTLAEQTGVPVNTWLERYGEHLFSRFNALYPALFDSVSDPIEFLNNVETVVHGEVLKLYPDAELPKFTTLEKSSNTITLEYTSSRNLSHLALGLIKGCLKHFGRDGEVSVEEGTAHANSVRFVVRLTP